MRAINNELNAIRQFIITNIKNFNIFRGNQQLTQSLAILITNVSLPQVQLSYSIKDVMRFAAPPLPIVELALRSRS